MKPVPTLILAAVLAAPFAQASSSAAWSAHQKEAIAACIKQSGLRDVKAISRPVEFDDRVAYTAVTLEGRYPQKHMKNQIGRELCLFDRKKRQAFVAETE